jgi:hypothetical protein
MLQRYLRVKVEIHGKFWLGAFENLGVPVQSKSPSGAIDGNEINESIYLEKYAIELDCDKQNNDLLFGTDSRSRRVR